tara:strand:- start:592 stop:1251 length:660 start_codon:yes stop_codon:yes gene_type:complete
MNLLIKYPTRKRPDKFLSTLKLTYDMAADKKNIHFLISYDMDDKTMTDELLSEISNRYPCTIVVGRGESKIEACNRDINEYSGDWDILLLLSDDMICQKQGWDNVIRKAIGTDTDKCLHYSDGYVGAILQTMYIAGRKYYDRFKYIYHPQYTSLWCDNEQMQVAKALNRYVYFPMCLFKHEHYSNNSQVKMDALMQVNESYYNDDKRTFERRQRNNFDL